MYSFDLDINDGQHKLLHFFTRISLIIKFVLIGQSIFYLYKISKLINLYKSRIREYFSNIKGKYFEWVNVFYIIFGVSLLAGIPPLLTGNSYLNQNDNHLLTVCFFVLSIVFYLIGFMADNHSYIEESEFYQSFNHSNKKAPNGVQKDIAKKIEQYFSDKKPFLNKDLKLTEVASALATNRTYISDTIRNEFNTNFNNYVNSYRVNEAVAMFNDSSNKNLTTIEISERAGFHSYNCFVKTFKGKYRCTPGAFRKKEVLV